MVALMNEDQSKFFELDNGRFSSILTMEKSEKSLDPSEFSSPYLGESFLTVSGISPSATLQLSNFNNSGLRLTPKGMLRFYKLL